LSELLERLGSIPAERVLLDPPLGTATEADLLRPDSGRKQCELVDGVIVEKAMGWYQSVLAALLIQLLGDYLQEHNLGVVAGPDGAIRLSPGLVREPDVAFVSWERLPGGPQAADPIPTLAPDLAVEILSKSNTTAEMRRKVTEYFAAGTRLVWILDPAPRTVQVYRNPIESTLLSEGDFLTAEDILPGFRLQVREWIERAEPPTPPPSQASGTLQ
jgi:Uma2 family endonuclease